jgi:hypothetical protein
LVRIKSMGLTVGGRTLRSVPWVTIVIYCLLRWYCAWENFELRLRKTFSSCFIKISDFALFYK